MTLDLQAPLLVCRWCRMLRMRTPHRACSTWAHNRTAQPPTHILICVHPSAARLQVHALATRHAQMLAWPVGSDPSCVARLWDV